MGLGGFLGWCFSGVWVLVVVVLEKTVSPPLGGVSTAVVVQGPGDLLHGHQGLVDSRGSLSFKAKCVGLLLKASGWSAQQVLCSAGSCLLCRLMPCYPPPVVFPPSHSQMELLLISAPNGKCSLVLQVFGRSGSSL